MLMFEHYTKPLLSRKQFLIRVLRYLGYTAILLSLSLGMGVVGYHYFDQLSWLDSLLNASMILTGMGPVDPMKNDAAKWFASCYAIFSGVAFLSSVSVLLAPVVHRFLHKHHLDERTK
jgi:hypothetical protein